LLSEHIDPRRLEQQPKRFRDGTFRATSPEETLARVSPHLKAIGITRIANVTGLDRIGVPVVMVCRPNSRSLATSQGKGLTLSAAKASGVMESIELYHGENVRLPLILGTYRKLSRTHRLVNVDDLAGVKNSRFHPDLQMLWIEGYDLMQSEHVWLPFEVVHCSASVPAPTGSGCFAATSNGLASGNHLMEAVLHALSELIERDAVALWEASEDTAKASTCLDLESVTDPACRLVIERCRTASFSVHAWEVTSDIGLPCFLCEIVDEDGATSDISAFTGMGCHPAREIALLRALTEAVQCRLTLISGSRDDLFRREYVDDAQGRMSKGRYKQLIRNESLRDFRDCRRWDSETFNEDVLWVLEQLRAAGIQRAIAVDLTLPEFGIPVVRMVVPGLEGPDDVPDYLPGVRARQVQTQRKVAR
jgi:YcaO-like protein with predicted kinase domain